MPNNKEKLREIYEGLSTPEERLMDAVELLESLDPDDLRGEDGHTPTEEELTALIEPLIPDPIRGDDGKSPTEEEILGMIRPLIPEPIRGADGRKITAEEVREKLKSLRGIHRLSVLDLKDLEWLRSKDGMNWSSAGFKVYTDSTLTGDGSSSNPLHVAGGGGGGFTELTATGAVNGANASFAFTKVPSYIVSDGAWYKKLDNNGNAQWSSSGLTVTMVIPPQSAIFGIA